MTIDVLLEGRYLLQRRIGQGGMGVVFKARHTFLKSLHAVKVILPDMIGNDPMLVTRFRQEAMVAAAIRHKNIVMVTDFGVVEGRVPFLVMHFIKGKSLQEVLSDQRRLPLGMAVEIISAVGAGVAAAHRQGFVHRDLKPLNIMVEDEAPIAEGVKVLDFGLAKIKSAEVFGSFVRAQTFGIMGSPLYMAPEQWSDEEPEKTADIYSMGIMLYQMLTGEVPFRGTSIPAIMKRHLTGEPPLFSSFGVKAPQGVEELVRQTLEKDPRQRPQSVEDFIRDLQRIVSEAGPLSAVSEGLPARGSQTDAQEADSPDSETIFVHGEPASGQQDINSLDETRLLSEAEEAERVRPQRAEESGGQEGVVRAAPDSEATVIKEPPEPGRADREEDESSEAQDARREPPAAVPRDGLDEYGKATELQVVRSTGADIQSDQPKVKSKSARGKHLKAKPLIRDDKRDKASRDVALAPTASGDLAEPARRTGLRRTLLMLGGALLVLAAVGFGLFRLTRSSNQTHSAGPRSSTEMVTIPGGTFMMGRADVPTSDNQWPAHRVSVNSFSLHKYEVTNAEYADFVREAKHRPPDGWAGESPPAGQERWPVVNVSMEDARAFAAWLSRRDGKNYRLPTEQEWEYAARGGDYNYPFPWGNAWVEDAENVGTSSLQPVGSHPRGASVWGALDMVGNAMEWTSTEASFYPGNENPFPESERNWFVVRGGSYLDKGAVIDSITTRRQWLEPGRKHPRIGFRLAHDN